jgi:hypothetical protein
MAACAGTRRIIGRVSDAPQQGDARAEPQRVRAEAAWGRKSAAGVSGDADRRLENETQASSEASPGTFEVSMLLSQRPGQPYPGDWTGHPPCIDAASTEQGHLPCVLRGN